MNPDLLVTLYILISTVLAVYFFKDYLRTDDTDSLLSTIIVGWSGLMYTSYFTQIISSPYYYYADWLISTPILIYLLSKELKTNAVTTSIAQFLTIFSALLMVLTDVLFFEFASFVFFGYVLGSLLLRGTPKESPFLTLITVVTFSAYPYLYVQNGFSLLGLTTSLVILPLISKHVFTVYKHVR